MSTNHYTPELHAHLKEVCAAEATNGMSPMFVSLPTLMMAVPLMVDEIDRLNEQVAQAWEEGFTQGAAYYHESGKEPTAYTETAATLNPYKEQPGKDNA